MIIPCLAMFMYDRNLALSSWLLFAQLKPEALATPVLFLFTQTKITKICFLDD